MFPSNPRDAMAYDNYRSTKFPREKIMDRTDSNRETETGLTARNAIRDGVYVRTFECPPETYPMEINRYDNSTSSRDKIKTCDFTTVRDPSHTTLNFSDVNSSSSTKSFYNVFNV